MLSKVICYSYMRQNETRNTTKANSKTFRLLIYSFISLAIKEHTQKNHQKSAQVDTESFINWNLKGNTVTYSPLSKSQKQSLKHPVKVNSNKKPLHLILKKVHSQDTPYINPQRSLGSQNKSKQNNIIHITTRNLKQYLFY